MFEKWKDKNSGIKWGRDFGTAPVTEPFLINDDLTINDNFYDKVMEDKLFQTKDDFIYKDGLSNRDEKNEYYNNLFANQKRTTGSQVFLDNINNPEGYNIWKNKVDNDRSMAPSGILGLPSMFGAFDVPTYDDHADLYYSPKYHQGNAMQAQVKAELNGAEPPEPTVWGQGWNREVDPRMDGEPNTNWLYDKLGINDGFRQPMWGDQGYFLGGKSSKYPEYASYESEVAQTAPFPNKENYNMDDYTEQTMYYNEIDNYYKARSSHPDGAF